MIESINNLVRANILRLTPYSTARDEYQGGIGTWMDANENPYENGVNRYPDPYQRALKKRIAEIKGCREEQIFIGNGSDEAIDLCYRIFCEPRVDNAVSITPTYGMYAVAAAVNDVELRPVRLRGDFSLDTEALLRAVDERTKLLFLCSPNNPTGQMIPRTQIEEILRRFAGIVVLDEAYIDFADEPGMLAALDRYPRLVILQTLSKAWGMAGLRLGLAFADPQVIDLFTRVKYPYNIGSQTQQAAQEILCKDITPQIGIIRQERGRVAAQLMEMPHVQEVYPSQANFLLIKTDRAGEIYRQLIDRGIIVRDRSRMEGCEGCLRITVGTPEENQKLIEVWKTL